MQTNIVVSTQVEGLHHWPDCPIQEVQYLNSMHRHMFHIKAKKKVEHDDRDIEIIQFKHDIIQYLDNKYMDYNHRCLMFGAKSCEMIAKELVEEFELSYCEVLEDGENGAEVQ